MLYFEWDNTKARENLEKHGISFDAAASVFEDPFAIEEPDQIVEGEERLRTTGISEGLIVIMVSHTNRYGDQSEDEITRIISARRATRIERRRYDELRTASGWYPVE